MLMQLPAGETKITEPNNGEAVTPTSRFSKQGEMIDGHVMQPWMNALRSKVKGRWGPRVPFLPTIAEATILMHQLAMIMKERHTSTTQAMGNSRVS